MTADSRSAPNTAGVMPGSVTLVKSWRWDAPMVRATRSKSGSTSATAAWVGTCTMKNTMITAKTTLEVSPTPYTIKISGRKAILGMALMMTMKGPMVLAARRKRPRTMPTSNPRMEPMAKPKSASFTVTHRSCQNSFSW